MLNRQTILYYALTSLALVALGFLIVDVWPNKETNSQPNVISSDPYVGKSNAKVTIVAFTDFECEYCSAEVTILKALVAGNGTNVKLVHKDFPLTTHTNATRAALIARCAQDQDKFWLMYDALFNHQSELATVSLETLAKEAGADATALETCVTAGADSTRVQSSIAEGNRLGVTDVPTIFINSERYSGLTDQTTLQQAINRGLQ